VASLIGLAQNRYGNGFLAAQEARRAYKSLKFNGFSKIEIRLTLSGRLP
jgi:hypothetical protein